MPKLTRSDVAILRIGDTVFGPLPRMCGHCARLATWRSPATHKILFSGGKTSHLARLFGGMGATFTASTFCGRLFTQGEIK